MTWKLSEIENDGEEKHCSETYSITKFRRQQWLRIAGVSVVLKEDKENAINGKQKDSFREETRVVSSTVKISVQNRHEKPLHPLSHQKCVEEKEPQRPGSIWEVRSTAVQRLLGRYLHRITL